MSRSRWLACGLLGFLGAVVLLWDPFAKGHEPDPLPMRPTLPGVADSAEIARQPAATLSEIQVIDRLTGETLIASVTLVRSANYEQELINGQTLVVPTLEDIDEFHYRLDDGVEHAVAATLSSELADQEWRIQIPYRTRIHVECYEDHHPLHADGALAAIVSLPESASEDASGKSSATGSFAFDSPSTTFAGAMNRHLRSTANQPIALVHSTSDGFPELLVSAKGPYCLAVVLADGTKGYAPITIEPGAELLVSVTIQRRPRLSGQLLDWHGKPVPDAVIQCSSALDLEDYDLGPGDGELGVIAIRQDGILHQVAKRTFHTDSDGCFSVAMPRGTGYSLESFALESYVFWTATDAHAHALITEPVILELPEPSTLQPIMFTIIREGNGVFAGATVIPTLASDLPFVRQFHKFTSDESGVISVLGMQPGDRAGMSIRHPSLKRGVYAPGSRILPVTREVEVVVPRSAFID